MYELLILSKSTNKSVWLKMKSTQKVTNIASQLPTYCDKGTTKLGKVTNLSRNTRFAFFFKFMFLKDLLKFSNLKKERLDKNEAN